MRTDEQRGNAARAADTPAKIKVEVDRRVAEGIDRLAAHLEIAVARGMPLAARNRESWPEDARPEGWAQAWPS